MAGKRAERLQVMLTHEEVKAVDEWRFDNRMPSRSAAARALMNLGLRAERSEREKHALLDHPISSGNIGIVDKPAPGRPSVAARKNNSVLLADSDFLVAQGISTLLTARGFEIVGPVASTEEAIALTRENRPDAAVLETRLREGETVEKLADELTRNNIPYIFCSVQSPRDNMSERFWSLPVVDKQQVETTLPQMLDHLLA